MKEGAFMGQIKKIVLIIISSLLLLLILCGAGAWWYYKNSIYSPMSGSAEARNIDVTISQGLSNTQIADLLYSSGLIKNKLTFRFYIKNSGVGSKLKAGKYALNTGMNAAQIVQKIVSGDVKRDTVKVTVPEGYALKDIADAVEKAGLVSKDKFLSAAKSSTYDYDFLLNLSKRPTRLEGYLFPDTYEFEKTATADQIIEKMLSRFKEVFTADMKKKAADMNMTVDQIVTIASIIEKEAKVSNERPVIAAVIYNRLKIKKNLEIDATVQYALGQWKDKLTYNDLKVDSPYNTYKYSGLPVGPISNPGKASLDAALNPDNVKYLYYVAKKDGGGTHVFTTTFQEHQNAIAQNR
jgi:conserved hypothetical protein, YceG family